MLSRRPAEFAACHQVEVQMGHGLARVLAAVVDQAETALHAAELRDLRQLFKNMGHHRAVLRRDIVRPADVLLRDHQHVHRGLRVQVLEREDLISSLFIITNCLFLTTHHMEQGLF